MSYNTERVILSGLVNNSEYASKVMPYLKDEYFDDVAERSVFSLIMSYSTHYSKIPNKAVVHHALSNQTLSEELRDECMECVDQIFDEIEIEDYSWLVDQSESFCRQKAVHNAIMKSISIYSGEDTSYNIHAIPEFLREAISVSFDGSVGMDYFDDAARRYDYYTQSTSKIPFDVEVLNEITEGGLPRKTLNVILAAVNAGKTMSMIHLASCYFKQGYNVVYFTMEMAEEEILRRIDANVLDVPLKDIPTLDRDAFMDRVQTMKAMSRGKVKVKEYPTGGASIAHFKHALDEMKLKQNFIPDVIIVDYIGIVASSRVKNTQANSYTVMKSVTEELRSLAVETNTVTVSAVQLNRTGISSSDVEMTDVADSMGIAHTSDWMIALTRTEELDAQHQILVKQLKSRYSNKSNKTRFVVGVDLDKQKLLDAANPSEGVTTFNTPQPSFNKPEQSNPFSNFKV